MPHLLGLVDLDGRVAGHGEVGQVEGQQLVRVVAEQAAERRVDLEPLAVRRDEPHPDRGVVERGPEALAGGEAHLLGGSAGRQVEAGADPADHLPCVASERGRVALDPRDRAVGPLEAVLADGVRAGRPWPRPRWRAPRSASSGCSATFQPSPRASRGVEPRELAPALVHVLVLAGRCRRRRSRPAAAPRGRGRRPRRTRAPRPPRERVRRERGIAGSCSSPDVRGHGRRGGRGACGRRFESLAGRSALRGEDLLERRDAAVVEGGAGLRAQERQCLLVVQAGR